MGDLTLTETRSEMTLRIEVLLEWNFPSGLE